MNKEHPLLILKLKIALKKKKLPLKKCHIQCSQKEHLNGSLFFCKSFRKKDQDERRLIQKKLHLCILCLCKEHKNEECAVKNCSRCGAKHNVLLCPKEANDDEVKIFEAREGFRRLW